MAVDRNVGTFFALAICCRWGPFLLGHVSVGQANRWTECGVFHARTMSVSAVADLAVSRDPPVQSPVDLLFGFSLLLGARPGKKFRGLDRGLHGYVVPGTPNPL